MIRPLRRAHLLIWLVLAIALPAVLLAGLWGRRPAMAPRNPQFHLEHLK